MLQSIVELLQIVKGETEYIRIAQGKNHLPNTLKETFNKIKTEARWHRKKQ
jgi:hypothetical protein